MQLTPTLSTANRLASRTLSWLVLALAIAWLATLGVRKLINPDESRYAEIPREMLATGDWLTPRLNDLKYFEKPPLQYWATAIAYQALGPTEFAARLWCGITGLIGILFTGWVGARLYGRDAGIIAAALLASSFMYFVMGHVNTLDMGLTFFLTVAIGAFLAAQDTAAGSKGERNFMLLAWAAAALALLSKGIVALVLPVLALVVYTAVQRDQSAWRRLHWAPGLLLFLIISAPWLIAVSIANPEFAHFFFLHEHFARFLTDVHQRVEPWWYFIPFVIAGSLPWTSVAIAAVVNAWRCERDGELARFRTRRFLIIWSAAVVAFFSISQSKLPPYILPIFPALALLVGDYLVRTIKNTALRNHLIGMAVLWVGVFGYLAFALAVGPLPQRRGIEPEAVARVLQWAAVAAAIAGTGTLTAWLLASRSRISMAVVVASSGTLVALSILIVQFDIARTIRSGYDLAQTIKSHQTSQQPFYSVGVYDHSLGFYLDRNFTIVSYNGELEFGQAQEPVKSLATVNEFTRAWALSPSGSLAVMKHDMFKALTDNGLPMQVIAQDLQLSTVKKP